MKAYHVLVLQHFGNYKSVKKIIVVAEDMPNRSDLTLRSTDEVLEIKEMQNYEVIIKWEKSSK